MIEDIRCPCDECNPPPDLPPCPWCSAAVIAVAVIVVILCVGSCWA